MNRYQWMKKNSSKSEVRKKGIVFAVIVVLSLLINKFGHNVSEGISEKIRNLLGKSASYILAGKLYCEENQTDFFLQPETENAAQNECETENCTNLGEYTENAEKNTAGAEYPPSRTLEAQIVETPPEGSIVEAAAGVYTADRLVDYDYVLNHFYVVQSVTTLGKDILNLPAMTATDLSIEKDSSVPQILIYHTHSQEWFSDTDGNGRTIVDVGSYLTQILTEQYGYNVIHLTDTFDMVNGVLDRNEAYSYSDRKISEVLEENPTIQVVIDLHRDGVDASRHFVTEINGKPTAKIMLFNGISFTNEQGNIDYLYNPYLTENLAMTYKMYLAGSVMYPDFIRCIFISGYRYNMHHRARSMLIEAGAQTNTYEEVCNAMEPLAQMLDRLLRSG